MAKDSLDDEFDRAEFYRGEDPDAGDDEYELEPPDEQIIAGEKRRAKEAVELARESVDIDKMYREHDSIGEGDIEQFIKDWRFQYSTKHLLIAMSVLAVILVIGRFVFGGFAATILVLVFVTLASIYGYFAWQEQQRRAEWEAERDELYRRNRERNARAARGDADA